MLGLALVLGSIHFATMVVRAQAPVVELGATPSSATATPITVSPDTVFTKPLDTTRQKELEKLYQALIEDYGEKARLFRLGKAQWQSIQTLRALEEAVLSTNAVLLSRTRTLITYLELLLEVLESTPGIELSLKQSRSSALSARIEWLRQHEQQILTATDRNAVNERSDDFTLEAGSIILEAEQALMLIRLGKLQTTFDRVNGLYERILQRNEANPGTPTQQFERKRAYVEVNILRDEIAYELRLATESLDEATAERGRNQSDYSGFVAGLESPYAKISRYLFFLEELARDTW